MRKLLAALLLALIAAHPGAAWASDWREMYRQDGIIVSSKEVPGSKLVAFRGETEYDAPVGRVLDVLLDNDHRTEWVSRLYINRVLERRNEFDYIIYQAFSLPAIFANRDYVYHGQAIRDPSGAVILTLRSTEHPNAPESVGVRAELVNSKYVLTPLGSDRTRIEVEIMTDPKGMMPAWLVNLVQKSWPLDTLSGIRSQLDQPWVGTHHLPGESPKRVDAGDTGPAEADEEPAAEPDSAGSAGDDAGEDQAQDEQDSAGSAEDEDGSGSDEAGSGSDEGATDPDDE